MFWKFLQVLIICVLFQLQVSLETACTEGALG